MLLGGRFQLAGEFELLDFEFLLYFDKFILALLLKGKT